MRDVEIALICVGAFATSLFIITLLCVYPPGGLWKGLFHREPDPATAFHAEDLEALQPSAEQERDAPVEESR